MEYHSKARRTMDLRPHSHRCKARLSGLRAGFVAVLICLLAIVLQCAAETATSAQGYQRPDAATIKSQTREVLSDSRYAPRISFWQWFATKMSSWDAPDIAPGKSLARIVLWIVTIWYVLALVAIPAHFIWTIIVLIRPSRSAGRDTPHDDMFSELSRCSYEELRRRIDALAREGRFRPAVGAMMLALLRWLDRYRVVVFHESKTNADYLGEYPARRPEKAKFRNFVAAFDGTIYGGRTCDRRLFDRMSGLFKEISKDVGQE